MDSDVTQKIILAALDEAVRQGFAVTVSVVDPAGHLTGSHRMEGCSFLALESSRKKAVTASQLKSPTHILADIEQKVPGLQRAFDKDPNLLTLPGGFPLVLDGQLIGGVGVSGGNFDQDKQIAQKASEAIA